MGNRQKIVEMSALWAAYGDALGFISELTDKKGLKHRCGVTELKTTLPWRRKIGGRFGAFIDLPAGCYSDDTQLRLSTCRAIKNDGYFDVEAFAKVELPVWMSYALGAGRGTKAAATSLSKQGTTWFSNFFSSGGSKYFSAGGNGAAMRVQPHVWISKDLSDPRSYLPDVIRNSICTHGHPRGFLGAAFHAVCLAWTMQEQKIPSRDKWQWLVNELEVVPDIIRGDSELSTFWLPVWEDGIGSGFDDALRICRKEISESVDQAIAWSLEASSKADYADLLQRLGAKDPSVRGSGVVTSVVALALAEHFQTNDPNVPLLLAANALESDTDTIATMAGALLGVVAEQPPEGHLLDAQYIRDEALRLSSGSLSPGSSVFAYPDLDTWKAPRSQLDAVNQNKQGVFVSGLGFATLLSEVYAGNAKDTVWQWLRLGIGQSVLCKRRESLKLTDGLQSQIGDLTKVKQPPNTGQRKDSEVTKVNLTPARGKTSSSMCAEEGDSIHELTRQAIQSNFDPKLIGHHIVHLSEGNEGVEKCIAYVAIIAKARLSRRGR